MSYQKEWLLLEANDEIDEMEHRNPSEEYPVLSCAVAGRRCGIMCAATANTGRFQPEE
ncbi:MAG: hypothetical protein ACLU9S_03845 [Oscillospiraceae bacterium]